ncbi:energy-coupling factor transporter transmembrane component T family protein [Psychromicrobium lacuslunae]|uniref:Cobalt permease-like transporter n=1 Tax=Psychromicrobium lacuslunae TaxID=1618207 RepID=A0A0D4BWP4_9MICC|nr:energy-coupling factor transporter transmembrane protein EcfT [Psychromicrobium lacuslunae]AJT40887.1 cobalt permease-like transporter [Psychromicrobium lacuslunae]
MRGHNFLIGQYVPGDSFLHRMRYLYKLLGMAVVGVLCYLLPLLFPPSWLVLGLLLLAVLLLFMAARLPWRALLGPIKLLWPVLLILGAYQCLIQGFIAGVLIAANILLVMLSCVYAASLLSLTSKSQEILDGLTSLVRPLRWLGADPERFALTVSMMFRSIPYLLGAYADVHDAAKARGLERSVKAHLMPTVISTVALAQSTGEALAARGIGD